MLKESLVSSLFDFYRVYHTATKIFSCMLNTFFLVDDFFWELSLPTVSHPL